MQRREVIGLIGAAALSFPRRGYAQTRTDLPLVGVLYPGRAEMLKDRIAALRLGLQEAGFIEGKADRWSISGMGARRPFDVLFK